MHRQSASWKRIVCAATRAAKKGTDVSRLTGCISIIFSTSKEPVCPRVELIFKIIIILLIIFLGFIKSKPC